MLIERAWVLYGENNEMSKTKLSPIERVLDRLHGVYEKGNGSMALCPAHDDKNPSLSINLGQNGQVLLKCFARCTTKEIVNAIGLTMRDLFVKSDDNYEQESIDQKMTSRARKPKPKRTYKTVHEFIETQSGKATTSIYRDAEGKLVMYIIRFVQSNGSKTFRPLCSSDGGFETKSPSGPLPLYRLPDLKKADRIYVVEGEKCAKRAIKLGLVATTSAFGSNSAHKTDWLPLAGRKVVILPDNDPAGQKYAEDVARIITELNSQTQIKIVELPGLPDGGDICDYTREHIKVIGNKGICKKLNSQIETTPLYELTTTDSSDDNGKENQLPTTEIDLSKRFVDEHVNELRFALQFGWLCWSGRHWSRDEMGNPKRLCQNTIKNLYSDLPNINVSDRSTVVKKIMGLERNQTVCATLSLAESNEQVRIASEELDRNLELFNHKTGTVDLNNFEFREHRRNDLITKIADVKYDLHAKCPRWRGFLKQIFAGETEIIDFLQRALGYSLTGNTSEQCLFMLHGSGANGKSTLLRVVQEILGDYAIQVAAETFMTQSPGKIRSDIARLRGSRLVVSVETQDGRRMAESLIKQLTGGDKMTARFLYKNEFEFVPQCKIWMAVNHKPRITGNDHAIWRRIHLIPFNVEIPSEKQDKKLVEKLLTERSGIFNWLIDGCKMWKSDGLHPPEIVKAATENYQTESDILGHFFDDRCIIKPNAAVTSKKLYDSYKEWAESSKEFILSLTKFGSAIRDRGYTKTKIYREKKKRMIYQGIRLKEPQSRKRK